MIFYPWASLFNEDGILEFALCLQEPVINALTSFKGCAS